MKPAYLGDGVYATFAHGMIELRTGSHTSEPKVYLEDSVFMALMKYGNAVFGFQSITMVPPDSPLVKNPMIQGAEVGTPVIDEDIPF